MTMKQYLLCGARIAHVSCLAFLLLGFSQIVKAQPTSTSPDYSITVFASWLVYGAFGNIPGVAYRGCFSSVASLSDDHG